MNFRDCRAACVSAHEPGTVLLFGGGDAVVAGGPGDWDRLRAVLDAHRTADSDRPHPAGGLAGAIAYDGSFHFHLCLEVREASTDTLWPPRGAGRADAAVPTWTAETDGPAYAAMVRAAQEHIRAGDIYQVNLARRFRTQVEGFDLRGFFRQLWMATSAPLAAFVELPGGGLASASPELFLTIQGRRIRTRPIKGTRPRDRDPERDSRNAFELVASPKEQAELIMITDLERNDLGQLCEYGSVRATELARREAHSHVFHLVSTVEGVLREGIHPVDAVRACFPGGSITGAPKRRAMDIIRALEPVPRGWYTGAIGYFGFDGSVQLNITIRTLHQEGGTCTFFTGSGITAGSDPVEEFHETNHKAAAMFQAWEQFHRFRQAVATPDGRG